MNTPPPIESLTAESSDIWGMLCTNRSQIAQRRRLRQLLHDSNPNQPPTDPARIALYEELTTLLQTGTHDRFTLYCPMYLIPHSTWYRRHPSIDAFIETYLASWSRLLEIQDALADFTDGDITADWPMICQAAQLGPHLLKRSLVTRQSFAQHTLYQAPILTPIVFDQTKTFSDNVECLLHDDTDYSAMNCNRINWFIRARKHKLIQSLAAATTYLLQAIRSDALGELSIDAQSVIITAIGMMIENGHGGDYNHLIKLAKNPEQRLYAVRTLCRLHSIDQCPIEILDELGIRYPTLDGPHFRHIADFSKQERIVETIKNNPALNQSCFPVCITYGSQLKGYAQPISDVDLAILIKPDARLCSTQIDALLDGSPTQLVGECTDAQVLFNGVWTGDQPALEHLAHTLLMPYIKEQPQHLLRSFEHDLLQYRLLHHGYETYHATNTATFFDDGYRKIASKLYASNVLVP